MKSSFAKKLLTTPNLTIIPIDETISVAAAILKYRYTLTLPDALQLATAIVNNQDAFVSNDKRFHKVKEIPVLLLDDFLASRSEAW
ncbi:MAG: PIN domain-containing protein [Candidatus Levybacteria bacterium]|nr:PIN domain-containing protein [Candidatus Levybacteria bacterium]